MNLRPSGYEPDELPDCSTPHQKRNYADLGKLMQARIGIQIKTGKPNRDSRAANDAKKPQIRQRPTDTTR